MEAKHLQSIELINKIDNVFTRDLTWLIYCKPITQIEGFSFHFANEGMANELFEWHKRSDLKIRDYEAINIPLGKYAEDIIKCYLENFPRYKLLASNLQLIENKVTIGELDYLLKDLKTHEFIHLEFSIKYYLKTKIKDKTIFLGPSTKDWMNRKIIKLKTHQTQLSNTHKRLLPVELREISFKQKAIIKGCLFYPWEEWKEKATKNETIEGWWLSIKKVDEIYEENFVYQIIKKKKSWIFPYDLTFDQLNFKQMKKELEDHFNDLNELMLVRYDATGSPIDRGFIVKDLWPVSHPNWIEKTFRKL